MMTYVTRKEIQKNFGGEVARSRLKSTSDVIGNVPIARLGIIYFLSEVRMPDRSERLLIGANFSVCC